MGTMTDEAKALVAELRLNDSEIYLPLLGKAADRIEALEAENERLREALREVLDDDEAIMDVTWRERARAAIEDKTP